jgi:hypothetical protein
VPTLADCVLAVLERGPALDDDELAARLGTRRQATNQVCHRLAAAGRIRRYTGKTGKIVNAAGSTGPADEATAPPPVPPPSAAGRGGVEPLSEDEVKQAIAGYLGAQGYDVHVAWGRTRGIDIDARRQGERLIIEAKGQVATPGPQQVNYFLGALGELVQRMHDPDAGYGLALSDVPQYRGLVDRLPASARERLRLSIFFVARNGDGLSVRKG